MLLAAACKSADLKFALDLFWPARRPLQNHIALHLSLQQSHRMQQHRPHHPQQAGSSSPGPTALRTASGAPLAIVIAGVSGSGKRSERG